jgi:hypothetical protein
MTSIDVCNLALSYLGNTREISSMAEQSTEAILCNRFYNISRESLLKMYPWNFAVKDAALTRASSIVDGETVYETNNSFQYVYGYPDDCLRVLKVMSANDGNEIVNDYNICYASVSLDMKRIACDISEAQAQYIVDIQDVTAMPSEFIDALSLMLATRLALPLTSSGQMAQAIQQQSSIAVDTAKRMCALERNQPLIKTNRYLDARR